MSCTDDGTVSTEAYWIANTVWEASLLDCQLCLLIRLMLGECLVICSVVGRRVMHPAPSLQSFHKIIKHCKAACHTATCHAALLPALFLHHAT